MEYYDPYPSDGEGKAIMEKASSGDFVLREDFEKMKQLAGRLALSLRTELEITSPVGVRCGSCGRDLTNSDHEVDCPGADIDLFKTVANNATVCL